MKDLALSPDESLPVYNRCAIHALAAAYLNLICQLTTVPAFCQHVHEVEDLEFLSDTFVWFTIICVNKRPLSSALQVIEVRQKESHYLLPEDIFIDNPKYVPHFTFISSSYRTTATLDGIFKRSIHARKCLVSAKKTTGSLCSSRLPSSVDKIDGGVLFLQSKITEVLGGSGYNTERLATPYVPQYTGKPLLGVCFVWNKPSTWRLEKNEIMKNEPELFLQMKIVCPRGRASVKPSHCRWRWSPGTVQKKKRLRLDRIQKFLRFVLDDTWVQYHFTSLCLCIYRGHQQRRSHLKL